MPRSSVKVALRRRFGVSLCFLGFAMVLAYSSADALATSAFSDIACPSTTNCLAVGSSDAIGTSQTEAAGWNGSEWASQSMPVPNGSVRSELAGVSCPAAGSCVGVGSVEDVDNVKRSLVMSWTSSSWSIASVPEPSGSKWSGLTDVACTSATACRAVGSYETAAGSTRSTIAVLSGSSWSTVTSPNVSGSQSDELTAISCSSTSACFAVGDYVDSSGVTKPLAVQWNGTAWSLSTVPVPGGATYAALSGVSCLTNNCTASGTYFDSVGVQRSMVVKWLGSTWASATTPEPSGATRSELKNVSCSSTTFCVAVGSYNNGFDDLPQAMTWNGTSWKQSAIDISTVGALGSDLTGIQCLSATFCHAAGSIVYGHAAAPRNLGFRFDGTSWVLTEAGGYQRTWSETSPSRGFPSPQNDVSCTTMSWCMRVGTYVRANKVERGFIQRWNGTAWTALNVPAPASARSTTMRGISCRTSTDCVAVGFYRDSSGSEYTYSASWNGSAWSLVTTPMPPGASSAQLAAVSCVTGLCSAVGSYVDSGGTRLPLAADWNGSVWTLRSVPSPSGAEMSALKDVSCASSSACVSVGAYVEGGSPHALMAAFTASTWTAQTVPAAPSGASGSELDGVSCPAATFCSVVGNYVDKDGIPHAWANYLSSGSIALGNGQWSSETVPSPGASRRAEFTDVACVSATGCVAVGSYRDLNGIRLGFAANRTEGAWDVVTISKPENIDESTVDTVSCVEGSGCIGTGTYSDALGIQRVMSMAWTGKAWRVGPSPEPSGAKQAELFDSTCVSSAKCYAVGRASTSGTFGLAVTGKPGNWAVMTTPVPSGAIASELADISCVSASNCKAVGNYVASGVKKHLAMSWNGTTWSIVSTPTPAGASSSDLAGIRCVSATSCSAVGSYVASGVKKTLAMSWNGSAWTVVSTPNPAGSSSSELNAVSCTATSFCIAAGTYVESGVKKALTLKWSGSTWVLLTTPAAGGSGDSELTSVSCVSTSWCAAVGYLSVSGNKQARSLTWNGTTWSEVTTSALPSISRLRDVSCTSSSACTAVGQSSYDPSELLNTALIATWNGSQWAPANANVGNVPESKLYGVACTAAGLTVSPCVAVGSIMDEKGQLRAMTSEWDATLAIKGPKSAINDIACQAGTCLAVGRIESEATDRTEVSWRLDSNGWTALPMPGVREGVLSDVACSSATACTATGSQNSGVLIERWDGTEWSVQTAPNPTGSSPLLTGVSCASASGCVAVGYYTEGTYKPLIESWNGTAWSIQTAVLPSGATEGWFNDVKCTSTSSCIAVGAYKDSAKVKHALAERWNGTAWSVVSVADPSGSAATELTALDCRSASNCKAVGNYIVSSSTYGFAASWNGTSWNTQETPKVENAGQTYLNGISCISSGHCVAVGYTMPIGKPGFSTLSLSWDGSKWSSESTPNRDNIVGTSYSRLDGVSCPTEGDCVAVGLTSDNYVQYEFSIGTPESDASREGGGGQSTATTGVKTLTAEQVAEAESLIAADPTFQAAVQGADYAMAIGPWTESNPEGATSLIGASAVVSLTTPREWESRVWPVIEYKGLADHTYYDAGTYTELTFTASASEITSLDVALDTEINVSGEIVAADVVALAPVAETEPSEIVYDEELAGEIDDPNAWEY